VHPPANDEAPSPFEAEVAEYIRQFPYQDTYNYAKRYAEGDPAKLNVWVLGAEPALVKAGDDKVVRMNNDNFYKLAFVVLDRGPVVLDSGVRLDGSRGTYTVTPEEAPVDAFWSLTVYDTERGGFLHPNDEDHYHINDTTAVRNHDGTVTFTFKQGCGSSDVNCLEVPAGRFDVTARYYLPHAPIIEGRWKLPGIELQGE